MGIYWKLANLTDKEILDFNGAKMSEMYGKMDTALIMKYMQSRAREFPKTIKFIADENGEWDKCAKFRDVTADYVICLLTEERNSFNEWEIRWAARVAAEAGRLDNLQEYIPPYIYKEAKHKLKMEQNAKKRWKLRKERVK